MKILLRKASDYANTNLEVKEINNIMELKEIYPEFIINFEIEDYLVEEYGNYDFQATIYDDYVE